MIVFNIIILTSFQFIFIEIYEQTQISSLYPYLDEIRFYTWKRSTGAGGGSNRRATTASGKDGPQVKAVCKTKRGDAIEAQHQIKQMINFILNEAKDKAEEIESGAVEDFNIEKMTLFEKKKDEVRSKIIKKINTLRLEKIRLQNTEFKKMNDKILRYQYDVLDDIVTCSMNKLIELCNNNKEYEKILIMLILSGILSINTDFILIRCRKCDINIIENIINDIKLQYNNIINNKFNIQKSLTLEIDNNNSLHNDLLGAILTNFDNTIQCDVTLNNQLQRTFKEIIPTFKSILFPNNLHKIISS